MGDPKHRAEALAAIESRKLTLGGLFELIQGGMAVIGRLAVFVPDENNSERFWGLAAAMIRLEDLLQTVQMDIRYRCLGYRLLCPLCGASERLRHCHYSARKGRATMLLLKRLLSILSPIHPLSDVLRVR